MSLLFTKDINANPFQIYIFTSRWEEKIKKIFPSLQISLNQSMITIQDKTQHICINAQKKIKSSIYGYRVQVIPLNNLINIDSDDIIDLELDFDLRVFDQKDINEQFEDFDNRKLFKTKNLVKKLIKKHKLFIIAVAPTKKMQQVKKQIKIIQNKQNQIIKQIQLDLNLTSQNIVMLQLNEMLKKSKQYNVDLFSKQNSLWCKGQINKSNQFKSFLENWIQERFIIFVEFQGQKFLQLENQKGQIFIYSQVQVCKKQILQKYNVDVNNFINTLKIKKQFLIVIGPYIFENQTKNQILKYKKRMKLQQKTKKVFSSRTIPIKYFDSRHMQIYFQKINYQSKNDIVHYQYDIQTTQISNNQITIELLIDQKYSTKKVQYFNKYFNSCQYIFIQSVNLQYLEPVINKLKLDREQNILTIQYISGFSQYPYSQIIGNSSKKQVLVSKIQTRDILHNSNYKYPFSCFLIKGMKNLLMDYYKEMISQTFQDVQRKVFEKQKGNLLIYIPSVLLPYVKDKVVLNYIQKQLIKSVICGSIQTIKICNSRRGKCYKCQIVSNCKFSQTTITQEENKLSNILNSICVQKLKQDYITIEKLKTIFTNSIFINGQNNEIILISFKKYKEYGSFFDQKMKSFKISISIPFPPNILHILQYIKNNTVYEKAQITFTSDNQTQKIKIDAYQWNIKQVNDNVLKTISKGKNQSVKMSILFPKDTLNQLKQNNILNQISQKYKFYYDCKQITFNKWKLNFPNGNKISINEISFCQTIDSYRIFFDENIFGQFSHPNNVSKWNQHKLDNINKVILVNKQATMKAFSNIVCKIVMNLDKVNMDYLLNQYSKLKLPQLIIYSSISLSTYIKNLETENKTNIVQFGWMEDNKQKPYCSNAIRKIINKNKQKQVEIILNEDDLQIKNDTFILNKSKLLLTYIWRNTQYNIVKNEKRKCYEIKLNDVNYEILKNQYDMIQNSTQNQLKVKLIMYKLNFNSMIQQNLFTGYQRQLYRKVLRIDKKIDYNLEQVLENTSCFSFDIHKQFNKIQSVKSQLFQRIKNLKQDQINLIINAKIRPLQQLQKLCEEKNIKIKTKNIQGENISLVLSSYDIRVLKQVVHDYKQQQQKMITKFQYPKHWTDQQEQISKVQVESDTEEFLKVQKAFSFIAIQKLFRIQNKYTWKKYSQQKNDLENLNKSEIKQMNLFHGTGQCDPDIICLDIQQSFNINYSSDGYFGRGIYFADKALYSDNYHYKPQQSQQNQQSPNRQMLYCKVLVGQSQIMQTIDRSIRNTDFKDEKKKLRYESIMSCYTQCNNTNVYVIYKNRRAYPQYLIEY